MTRVNGTGPAAGRRITSFDVARRAGVSRATVSHVLNDTGSAIPISAATRERVLDAARQLEYYPNVAARSLRQQRTGMIGLAINESTDRITTNSFLPLVIKGIASVLKLSGVKLLIEPYDATSPEHYIGLVRGGRVDGLILAGPRADGDDVHRLRADDIPLVLWGRLPASEHAYVDIDNVAAARKAVEHLLGLGHLRVGCITNATPGPRATEAADRLEGYRQALEAAGLAFEPKLVRYGQYDPASGEAAMHSLLTEDEPPTGVFVASDEVTFGAMRAARALGVRIPEDVALVGFDDLATSAHTEPPLTTIRVPAREIGAAAARSLLKGLGARRRPESVLLPTELIIRASSGSSIVPAPG